MRHRLRSPYAQIVSRPAPPANGLPSAANGAIVDSTSKQWILPNGLMRFCALPIGRVRSQAPPPSPALMYGWLQAPRVGSAGATRSDAVDLGRRVGSSHLDVKIADL